MSSDSKLVLSYNICFQAMCHDGHGSAAQLGLSCTWSTINNMTICGLNIAKLLNDAPTAEGHQNFDFVGLQEANYADELQIQAKDSLAAMKMITSKATGTPHAKGAKMASFYNGSKYTLDQSFCGTFSSHDLARPFHILLLTEITTNNKLIFINVHTPHGRDLNTHTKVPYQNFDAVSYDLSEAAKSMASFDASQHYKIIMTGDFNETGWDWKNADLRPKQWSPLHYAGLATQVSISNFVFSCSKDDGCWHKADAQRGGDYIFYSENAATIKVPSNYTFAPLGACSDVNTMKSIWQSDHLPVLAVVD
jgi:endonuclease/exonuclease/phosphatase family metal-dependent hydrolase